MTFETWIDLGLRVVSAAGVAFLLALKYLERNVKTEFTAGASAKDIDRLSFQMDDKASADRVDALEQQAREEHATRRRQVDELNAAIGKVSDRTARLEGRMEGLVRFPPQGPGA